MILSGLFWFIKQMISVYIIDTEYKWAYKILFLTFLEHETTSATSSANQDVFNIQFVTYCMSYIDCVRYKN